ncbi:NRAMP family divalent metal transporter [Lacibacter sp. H375]|uniref:NRAMP family divalent metal transporter n=1 Tax=Lacibacter sp. H375 TaxID=3133424 RepID=UPI0030C5C5AC
MVSKQTNWKLLGGKGAGAAFLMATSAIGPGFLTQTTVFTQQLMASMGFVILVSVIIDIIAQLNIWQILTANNKRGSELANEVVPNSGHVLTVLICIGGLAFNIGNISGAGLGLNILFPVSVETGSIISSLIGIVIFLSKDIAKSMDLFVKILGIVMLGLMIYVVFYAAPPLAPVVHRTFAPSVINFTSIVTLVGGTVGGYITFAGAHRLLEDKSSTISMQQVKRSAVNGIVLTACMRILLFLAVYGILNQGFQLNAENPTASVFQAAAGTLGYKIFGVVLWCAAITSVVGSAFTSITFLKTLHPVFDRQQRLATILFILISTGIFLLWGKPVFILILVGTLNGFILPFSLGLMLWIMMKRKLAHYQHPAWLLWTGWIVVAVMLWMSVVTFINEIPKLF